MKKQHYIISAIILIVGVLFWVFAIGYVIKGPEAANSFTEFFKRFIPSLKIATTTPESGVSDKYESKVDYEQAIMDAVDRVTPSVVAITISKNVPIIENCQQQSPFSDLPPELRDFFGGNFQITVPCQKGTEQREVGGGSGFIVSSDGLILTNKHVVSDDSASYTVITNDGKKYNAKVLAKDKVQDLAVIKIDAFGLSAAVLGDSDKVRLAQTAISIGNALAEFRNTVSAGIVSGLARTVSAGGGGLEGSEVLEGVIQTDAAINPGNSGGPLINLRGEVIGINTAIVSGAQSIGFALPINNAKRDIKSVQITGNILTPFLGLRYRVITPEFAKEEKLSVEEGALVRGLNGEAPVVKGGPADKAGIKAEDIILEVDGIKITQDKSLLGLVQKYSVGDTIKLKVLRDGKEIIVPVVLEERK